MAIGGSEKHYDGPVKLYVLLLNKIFCKKNEKIHNKNALTS